MNWRDKDMTKREAVAERKKQDRKPVEYYANKNVGSGALEITIAVVFCLAVVVFLAIHTKLSKGDPYGWLPRMSEGVVLHFYREKNTGKFAEWRYIKERVENTNKYPVRIERVAIVSRRGTFPLEFFVLEPGEKRELGHIALYGWLMIYKMEGARIGWLQEEWSKEETIQ